MAPVAIITGGSRGIGAATALAAARHGYDVCVAYQHCGRDAERVAAQCRAVGVRAMTVQADVAEESSVLRLFSTVDDTLGTFSALVNNAGIVAPQSRLVEMDTGRITEVLRVNVVGAFLCARGGTPDEHPPGRLGRRDRQRVLPCGGAGQCG